jgi:hypothetical protein
MSNPNPPSPQIRPTEKRPTLGDLNEMALLREQVRTAWETLDLLQSLPSLFPSPAPGQEQSTEIPVSPPVAPTTPQPPASPTTDIPEGLKSVQGDQETETLANGTEVPRYLIEVLNDFEKVWPGASFHNARPALVGQIIMAQNAKASTLYPFCMNDDPKVPLKESPCIRRKGHTGRHKDNDDGTWP